MVCHAKEKRQAGCCTFWRKPGKKYNLADKNIYNYQQFDQLAKNPDIDVVDVVVPPCMHRKYVIKAANAGKHASLKSP
jgi:glucose-fructose oxidoreductase